MNLGLGLGIESGSSPFNPKVNLAAAMIAMFDSDTGATTSAWTDQTAHANAAQGTVAPTIQTNIFGTKPGVRFGAAGAGMIASTPLAGLATVHIFQVLKANANPTTAVNTFYLEASAGGLGIQGRYNSVSGADADPRAVGISTGNNDTDQASINLTSMNGAHIWEHIIVPGTPASYQLLLDGVSQTLTVTGTQVARTLVSTMGIGFYSNTQALSAFVDIGAHHVFNRQLTASEAAAERAYLKQKFGTP